jgi:hypothetical protein
MDVTPRFRPQRPVMTYNSDASVRAPMGQREFQPRPISPAGERPRFNGTGPLMNRGNDATVQPRRTWQGNTGERANRVWTGRTGGTENLEGRNRGEGGGERNWRNREGGNSGDWRNRRGDSNTDWRNRGENHDWRNRGDGDRDRDWNRGDRHRHRGNWSHRHRNWDRSHRDRSWWRSNYTRFTLFGGGYYYWNQGYWYPAYGYDPYFSTYSYDAPLYAYNGLAPAQVIAEVQSVLQQRGYYRGAVDGAYGPMTRRALQNYQADHGLPITGELDEETLYSLGFE